MPIPFKWHPPNKTRCQCWIHFRSKFLVLYVCFGTAFQAFCSTKAEGNLHFNDAMIQGRYRMSSRVQSSTSFTSSMHVQVHKSDNILRINLSPRRENKFTAVNSPRVSSLPPSRCFPRVTHCTQPRAQCFAYWTSHVLKCKLWSTHTRSNFLCHILLWHKHSPAPWLTLI